jgi:hypothetical protein
VADRSLELVDRDRDGLDDADDVGELELDEPDDRAASIFSIPSTASCAITTDAPSSALRRLVQFAYAYGRPPALGRSITGR